MNALERGQKQACSSKQHRHNATGERTLLNGEKSLNGTDEHHADHHDGEYRDGITRHPHDEQVHGNLLQRTQRYVPRFLHKTWPNVKEFYIHDINNLQNFAK